MSFDHQKIEKKWQEFWQKNQTFRVESTRENEDKLYFLTEFPYPSGNLHVGHWYAFCVPDILVRYFRMRGRRVLFPFGFDAFGLPAENAAIKNKLNPRHWTEKNMQTMRAQIDSMGASFDFSREIRSCDPEYYRWTQWLFLQLWKNDLAEQKMTNVNWCPDCKTVLANEQVQNGACERCGHEVRQKNLKQWNLKITNFADELIDDLDGPNVILVHGLGGRGQGGWFADVAKICKENEIECDSPDFPDSETPKYEKWAEFFEKNLAKKVRKNSILVGHSLGGSFLLRFLSENNLECGQLILVAPAPNDSGLGVISNFFEKDAKKRRLCDPQASSGGHSKGASAKNAPFFSSQILFKNINKVKFFRRNKNELFSHFSKTQKTSIGKILFDGQLLFRHFVGKNQKEELHYRISFAKTVFCALPQIFWNSENTGYFACKKSIFRVVLEKQAEKEWRVKNFYRCQKLSREFYKWGAEKKVFNYEKIRSQAGQISVFGGGKDEYISGTELENLAKNLGAEFHFSEKSGHFGPSGSEKPTGAFEKLEKIAAQKIHWPEEIKTSQKNWIGRSTGAEVDFEVLEPDTKKGEQFPEKLGGCSNDTERSAFFSYLDYKQNFYQVKKKIRVRNFDLRKIKKNHKNIIFDGQKLWLHFRQKPKPEIIFRCEWALTIFNYLQKINFVSTEKTKKIGYLQFKNNIFRVVLRETGNQKWEVATFYKVQKMSEFWTQNTTKKSKKITVFTTRPDTIFGATFLVLAPEHPLLDEIVPPEKTNEIQKYRKECEVKTDLQRTDLNKNKTGIFTGAFARNPANGGKIPIWVADYVLLGYGSGAIMAVPAHDDRDREFAAKYDLPIRKVISGIETPSQKTGGKMKNSGFLNGLNIPAAIESATDFLEKTQNGRRTKNYRLRDWTVSRQRYWGCPIPAIHCEKCGAVPVPEKDLPVQLPEIEDYLPRADGASPLAKSEKFLHVPCPKCGEKATRETDTFDTFMCSSWYFLRYLDPENSRNFCDREILEKWMPVDFYSGGAEHTTMHLLYSRFFTRALHQIGLVPVAEPYKVRQNRGLILGPDGAKMSKSKGNVIDPDSVVAELGADTVRMYLAFIGPFNEVGSYPWNPNSIRGIRRFLEKIWRISDKISDEKSGKNLEKIQHESICQISESTEKMKFNTAISQLMIWERELEKSDKIPREIFADFLRLLSPFAPHLAAEIWAEKMGEKSVLALEKWPKFDPKFLEKTEVKYAVQVNGKLREVLEISAKTEKSEVLAAARALPKIQKYLDGQNVKKEIFVPEKIVGFVI